MRVAIVHDWFVVYAGAERVIEQLLEIYPHADLLGLVDFLPDSDRTFIGSRPVKTSFLQKMPFARKRYRDYLPLFPLAIEQLDMRGYDLVISSSYAVAKGVITSPDQLHICYCHSPMRYAWDLREEYLEERNIAKGLKVGARAHDLAPAARVGCRHRRWSRSLYCQLRVRSGPNSEVLPSPCHRYSSARGRASLPAGYR